MLTCRDCYFFSSHNSVNGFGVCCADADYEQAHIDDIADDCPCFSSSVSCIVEHYRSPSDVVDISSDDDGIPF